ncbi:MAG: flavodoxin domain-containing protein [Lachnospiraceae bacterium]|nr:flavodoxin domain-containing protein [Lachnospiraceae bacterium]
MKTLIIYTSQTGFTKKYAEWIAQRVDADLLELKEAQKKDTGFFADYDAIVYGGWAMAGTVFKSKWFFDKASEWKEKRLAIFCVGGSPNENADVDVMLKKLLNDDQKQYIAAFYCQGGFNYEKMNTASRLAIKMFVGTLKKKKDQTEEEKKMVEMISSSYDISDISYTDPIVEYLQSGK